MVTFAKSHPFTRSHQGKQVKSFFFFFFSHPLYANRTQEETTPKSYLQEKFSMDCYEDLAGVSLGFRFGSS